MKLAIPDCEGVNPWDVFAVSFRVKDDMNPRFKKDFAFFQRGGEGLSGFIIVGWGRDDTISYYYHDSGEWESINDARLPEYPKIYLTFLGLMKALRRLKEKDGWLRHVGLAYWVHGEAHDQPLDSYVRLTEGNEMPGSPRQ